MNASRLSNIRRKWIVGHTVAWLLAYVVIAISSRGYSSLPESRLGELFTPITYLAIYISIIMVVVEWFALRPIIRKPWLFFPIVLIGWFFGTFGGLCAFFFSPGSSFTRSWGPIVLVSALWGGSVGLGQMIAWASLVRRAYLWLFTQWFFILVTLFMAIFFSSILYFFLPIPIEEIVSAIISGFIYSALTSYVLIWQLKHPIFAPEPASIQSDRPFVDDLPG